MATDFIWVWSWIRTGEFSRTGFEFFVKAFTNLEIESGSGEEIGQEVKLVVLHGPRFNHSTKPRCWIFCLQIGLDASIQCSKCNGYFLIQADITIHMIKTGIDFTFSIWVYILPNWGFHILKWSWSFFKTIKTF